jgi:hypothetical protein
VLCRIFPNDRFKLNKDLLGAWLNMQQMFDQNKQRSLPNRTAYLKLRRHDLSLKHWLKRLRQLFQVRRFLEQIGLTPLSFLFGERIPEHNDNDFAK